MSDSFWKKVAVSVVASVIVAVLGWATSAFWYELVPGLFGGSKSDVLAGTRNTQLEGDPNAIHETAELHQFRGHVWGESVQPSTGSKYKLDGQLYGNLLVLTYQQNGAYDAGAILLKIEGGSRLMSGFESGVKAGADSLYSRKYSWKKLP